MLNMAHNREFKTVYQFAWYYNLHVVGKVERESQAVKSNEQHDVTLTHIAPNFCNDVGKGVCGCWGGVIGLSSYIFNFNIRNLLNLGGVGWRFRWRFR